MGRYSDAVLALHGQTGANGETLQVLRYYTLGDGSGTNADDLSPSGIDGTYVGTPTLTSEGPLYGETNGGNCYTGNETSMYVTGGTLGSIIEAISSAQKGLTVLWWQKNTNTADWDYVVDNTTSTTGGILIAHNTNTLENYVSGQYVARITDGSGNVYQKRYAPSDTRMSDGVWRMHEVFAHQSGPTIEYRLDRWLQTAAATSGSVAGTFSSSSQTMWIGRARTGTGARHFNGSLAHVAWIHGKLTDTQRKTLMDAATYDRLGAPNVHSHFKASDAAINAGGDDLADFSVWTDETDAEHHLGLMGASNPKYVRESNWNQPGADFDNFYQNGGATSPYGADFRTALENVDPVKPVQPTHFGLIVVCRPLATTIAGVTNQCIAGLKSGTTIRAALCIPGNDAAGTINGGDEIASIFGATVRYGDSNFPKCRTGPGLVIVGMTVGQTGDVGVPRLFMNRWKSNGNAAGIAAAAATEIFLGGVDVSTHGNLFAGRIEEALFFNAPFTDAEFDAFCAQRFAEAGESLYPRNHVTIGGSSSDALRAGTNNRNRYMRLPDAARRNASWWNSSVASARIAGTANIDVDVRNLNSAKAWDGGSGCKNWFFNAAGLNNLSDGDSGAAVYTDYATVRALAVTGMNAAGVVSACQKFAVYGLPSPPATDAAPRTDYHSLLLGALGVTIDVYIPPSPLDVDGTNHPTDAGQQTAADDIWYGWGIGALRNSTGGIRSRNRTRR